MKKLIIFGLGEQAELAHYYFSRHSSVEVAGFTVDAEHADRDSFCGLPVLPFEDEEAVSPDKYSLFIAVGYKRMNDLRAEKYAAGKKRGFSFLSYVDERATVAAGVTIGENAFILEQNNIQPFVTIGNNVTLWSGNHIGHHSTIEDNCFITSHVVVSGGVNIGRNTFIGVNATLFDHIKIAEYTFIGGGCLIQRNTKPRQAYMPDRSKPGALTSDDLFRGDS